MPLAWAQLEHLGALEASGNAITEAPAGLGCCQMLVSLDLSANKIAQIPIELGNLTPKKLQTVRLHGNPLADPRIRRFVAQLIADHHGVDARPGRGIAHGERRLERAPIVPFQHHLVGAFGQACVGEDLGPEATVVGDLELLLPRQQQQRLEKRLHVVDRAPHPRQRIQIRLRPVLIPLQQVQGSFEHGDGCPQIVTGIAGEHALPLDEGIEPFAE